MSYVAEQQDAFRAIADHNRRRMLDAMLGEERCVSELTALLAVRQSTVSQHLKVLKLAGLVEERRQGRNSFYRAKPAELLPVIDWAAKYHAFWNGKLDALERHLAKQIN
jgi:DNA-binding transcriptional ArsR family regulator